MPKGKPGSNFFLWISWIKIQRKSDEVADWRAATLLKRDSSTGVFVAFSQFLRTHISYNTCKWLPPKPRPLIRGNYAWFAWLILLTNKLAIRNWFKGKESNSIWLKHFYFLMKCRLNPSITLFMTCRERYSLCTNRASLDRESLDYVSWNSPTH